MYTQEGGNISKIAKKSGLSRKALYDLIKKFDLKLTR